MIAVLAIFVVALIGMAIYAFIDPTDLAFRERFGDEETLGFEDIARSTLDLPAGVERGASSEHGFTAPDLPHESDADDRPVPSVPGRTAETTP